MEDFGARNASPEEFCEQAVTHCDLYVGLLGHLYGSIPEGSHKSQTELEYDAAVAANKPRFVFLADNAIPVPPDLIEDDEKRALQAFFRGRVDKDRIRETFISPDDLRALVVQAIRNWEFGEKSQRERDREATLRSAKLDGAEKASYARCALRWEAAGVPEDLAQRLASDQSIGALGSGVAPKSGAVVGLVGTAGAGKSLGAERLYQRALAAFRREANAPIPIFLEARGLTSSLSAAIVAEGAGLGDLPIQGAFVVLDGLDEREPAVARSSMDELRALVRSWPNTGAIVTTRPVRGLLRDSETIVLEPLSEKEALQFLSRFAGRQIEFFPRQWPESVRDAARRPLFATVLGRYLAANEAGMPTSVGEVIRDLVRRLLDRVSLDPHVVEPLLRRLAAARIEHGEPVSADEIGIASQLDSLAKSRVVVETGRRIDFSLQVIGEWFAAEGLLRGEPNVEELTGDDARLDRWRYPIVVAVSFGDESAARLMSPLAAQQPGFASTVAKLTEPQTDAYEGAPTKAEDGAKIRTAMEDWVDGIGPLAELIAPLREDGSLGSLGFTTGVGNASSSWYVGSDIQEDVFDLGARIDAVRSQRRRRLRLDRSSGKPAWPWLWSLKDLSVVLEDLMKDRALPVLGGPLHDEAIWQLALATCGQGSLSHEPIRVTQLEAEIDGLSDETVVIRAGSPQYSVASVRHLIELLENRGQDVLRSPWPEPDGEYEKGWIWEPYSADRLLERTRAVYGAALESYEALVTHWFPRFTPWLRTAATLPATLKGTVVMGRGAPGSFSGPSILWYLEPLPDESPSSIDIVLGTATLEDTDFDPLMTLYRGRRAQSPSASPIIRDELLEIFDAAPVTELVYDWLWDDLQAVEWVDGLLSRRHM